jgi:hypothetical protein
MARWLSDSDFEDEKWRRRAARLAAPRMAYHCEKCGQVGIPQSQRGYGDNFYTPIHVNGPWHLPDGRVNSNICRGRIVWKEIESASLPSQTGTTKGDAQ